MEFTSPKFLNNIPIKTTERGIILCNLLRMLMYLCYSRLNRFTPKPIMQTAKTMDVDLNGKI